MFFFFSSIKLENKRVEQALPKYGKGDDTSWRGKVVGKKGKRMNTVQIIYTHVCKCKVDTCQKYSRNEERGR
jgi:hypothetical protein